MRLYVGNLAYRTNEEDLRNVFEQYGTVDHVEVITDRESGRSKGFGFVEMANDSEAKAAIEATDGKEIDERALKVNEARPRPPRPTGGGGRRYGGSRDGGRDGDSRPRY